MIMLMHTYLLKEQQQLLEQNTAAAGRADERDKGVIRKNCLSFIKCISKINDTEIYNAQDIDILMVMYNLIEYSDNYLKTSGSLWQYYKD